VIILTPAELALILKYVPLTLWNALNKRKCLTYDTEISIRVGETAVGGVSNAKEVGNNMKA
jgi:hypothetical protein